MAGWRVSLCLIVAALGASVATAVDPVFTDQTVAAGVVNTFSPPPAWNTVAAEMAGGAVVADFDRDGRQDLFVLGGGDGPDRLFINNGDGTFTDQAVAWGVAATHLGGGVAAGDYDGDGWIDLFVASFGPPSGAVIGAHKLYHNNGDGTFTDVAAAAGVAMTNPDIPDGFGAAFGDYDLDGDLDLAVAGWMGDDGTQDGATRGNRLFRNNGDGTFTDVTAAAGVEDLDMHGFSPRFVDMDGDLYPELLMAADFQTSHYFINNRDGTFTDFTAQSGTGLDRNGMGSAIGDFDNDGLLDWYVTSIYNVQLSLTGNMLYRNLGAHVFEERSEAAGVKQGGWGWGTCAVDLNHDGWQDIAATNGWVYGNYLIDATRLYRNNGDGTFTDVAVASGLNHTGQGRALLTADFDDDGDQDIVIVCSREPLVLYRNDLSGPNTNWLRVFLDTRGAPSLAPDGIGARVVIRAGGRRQVRYISPGSTYLGGCEPSAHFGLGAATNVERLRVEWPDGGVTILRNVAVNQTLTI
ncbi:MAG: CRTAC1 family protein, partial [Planctomycetota bacterium]